MKACMNHISQQDLNDLLKPGTSFDWAEDVEEMLELGSSHDSTSSSSSSTVFDYDDLLRPDDFRWDEEDWDSVDKVSPNNASSSSLIVDGSCSMPERPGSPLGFYENMPDYADDFPPEPPTCVSRFSNNSSLYNGEWWLNEDTRKSSIQADVQTEFAYRDYRMHMVEDEDQGTHHFNWMGHPVSGYSATPPAISLMFMLAAPKVPLSHGDEMRLRTLLAQAMVYIDPVVVCLENGPSDLLKTGHELIRWSTGRVYKFYSLHGSWTEDDREEGEQTIIDMGDINLYTHQEVAHGNGFVQLSDIRSRYKWEEDRNERFQAFHAPRTPRPKTYDKDHRVFKPSPLRQTMVMEEEDVPDTESQKTRATIEMPKVINCEVPGTLSKYASVLSLNVILSTESPQARVHAFDLAIRHPYLKYSLEKQDPEATFGFFEPKLDAINEDLSEDDIEESGYEDIDDAEIANVSYRSSYTLPLNSSSKYIRLGTASTIQDDSESSLYRAVYLAQAEYSPSMHGKRTSFLELVKAPFRLFSRKVRKTRKPKRMDSSTSSTDWICCEHIGADDKANDNMDDIDPCPTLSQSQCEEEYVSFPKPDLDIPEEICEESATPISNKTTWDSYSFRHEENGQKKKTTWAKFKVHLLTGLCTASPYTTLPFRG